MLALSILASTLKAVKLRTKSVEIYGILIFLRIKKLLKTK